MKIIVTGSLGYVGKPLTEELIKKGHSVTVISSSAEKQKDIEALGAKAAIGTMGDANFLIDTFTGADAVYCMLALHGSFADPGNTADKIIAQADTVANNYVQAIERSGVKRVVYLSSIGADMEKDSGLIIIHHHAEKTLNKLPSDVNISFMRPSGFYKNLFAFVPSIKAQGIIAASYGGDDINIFVSSLDIADAIVEEIESKIPGKKVRYIASEELTCNEAAGILGAAIGKPDLKWLTISDEQQLNGYKAHGMNDSLAQQFVEMNASIHKGKFYKDYNQHKSTLGKVKLKDFAKEFAAAMAQ
ncbi:NAD(P)H-binding protein [Mucilaginibacter sp. L196]|uniref:NAD(P)H-binding protein n=1 Tax=Mucilaginibacter sp. L196 TaxID=1641870 RepID=UPI00131E536D|nr:NAD(P)H-binding protein [Mucilaginibacter sp. L196]